MSFFWYKPGKEGSNLYIIGEAVKLPLCIVASKDNINLYSSP